MERARFGDVELDYDSRGRGEPLLFIHGAFVAREYDCVVGRPEFPRERFRAITYDRPGYRKSTRDPFAISMEVQAQHAAKLLRYLGIERAHVVGSSFGGSVALALAIAEPELVQSLVVMEPAIFIGESADGYRASLLQLLEASRTSRPEDIVADAFAPRIGTDFRALLDSAAPGSYEQAVEDVDAALLLDLPAVVSFRFSSDNAKLIEQPVLCVIGEKSESLWDRFGEVQRALLSWLPKAEGFVLPGATHALQMQNPVDLTMRLVQFIDSHAIEK